MRHTTTREFPDELQNDEIDIFMHEVYDAVDKYARLAQKDALEIAERKLQLKLKRQTSKQSSSL